MAARKIRLNRDFLLVAAPAGLIVLGAFALTLLLMRPAPPTELVMSTGTADGMYHAYAMKYRDILARDGVTLRLWPSAGAVENLRRLADPSTQVDVALVQGGIVSAAAPESVQGLVSLGSVDNEVLWVFYRGDRELDRLPPLNGKMIAVGAENSGSATLAMTLLDATGIAKPPTTVMKAGGQAAANLLLSGSIDAAFFVADPRAPVIQELVRAQQVHLLSFARADAYTRRYFFLQKFTLPRAYSIWCATSPSARWSCSAPPSTWWRETICTRRWPTCCCARRARCTALPPCSRGCGNSPPPTTPNCLSAPRPRASTNPARPCCSVTCPTGARTWSIVCWCS